MNNENIRIIGLDQKKNERLNVDGAVERMDDYLIEIRKQPCNTEAIKVLKKEADELEKSENGENATISKNNLDRFHEYGITDLLRKIKKRKIVNNGPELDVNNGMKEPEIRNGYHYKNIDFCFDGYIGNEFRKAEFGNRIRIYTPTDLGVNIHGFAYGKNLDGKKPPRKTVWFKEKSKEEIIEEISMTMTKFIGEIQGYPPMSPERTSLDKVE